MTGFLYLMIFIVAPSGAKSATAVNMSITLACDVGVALLLYELLRPVSRPIAILAALFRLAFVVAMALNALSFFGILNLMVHDSRSSSTFDMGYGISLIPFGVHCLLIGLLIYRASFLPKTLGILMAVAGLGYLIFIWPSLGQKLFFPYIVIPAVLGEGALTLWLLTMGVNVEKWRQQQASASIGKKKNPVPSTM